MSSTIGPKKSLLKFKSSATSIPQKVPASNLLPVVQKQENTKSEVQPEATKELPESKQEEVTIHKTEAEKSFDLIKKHRIIHKMTDKAKISNKERLEKRNKLLSKLPDHFDLARTGEKIQKGY